MANDGSVNWEQPADLVFRTRDHPQANGRVAADGDYQWSVRFPMEDGRTLEIQMGVEEMDHFERMLLQKRTDDALEAIGVNPHG